MQKFILTLEIEYDGLLGLEPNEMPQTKARINQETKTVIHSQIKDALEIYGITNKIIKIVKRKELV